MREIKEGAWFVADAHYPHHGDAFERLLDKLSADPSHTPQLFLMGDIFDLLFGYNRYILRFSQPAIEKLRRVSRLLPVFYVEGNHDFCLKPLFPDIHIFSYKEQPCYFRYGQKRVALAHGDRFDVPWGYRLYTAWLRRRVTLTLLRPWQRFIIDHRMRKLSQKRICRTYEGFDTKAARIVSFYRDADMIIEGHFHQGKKTGRYVSLPSLACQHAVGVARNGDIDFVPFEKLWDT